MSLYMTKDAAVLDSLSGVWGGIKTFLANQKADFDRGLKIMSQQANKNKAVKTLFAPEIFAANKYLETLGTKKPVSAPRPAPAPRGDVSRASEEMAEKLSSAVAIRIMEKLSSTAMERYILRGGKASKDVHDNAWLPYWNKKVNNAGGEKAMISKMHKGVDNHIGRLKQKGIVREVIHDAPSGSGVPKEEMAEAMNKAIKEIPEVYAGDNFLNILNSYNKAKLSGKAEDFEEYRKLVAPHKNKLINYFEGEGHQNTHKARNRYRTGDKLHMGQTVPVVNHADNKVQGFDIYDSGNSDEAALLLTKAHEASEAVQMKNNIGKTYGEFVYNIAGDNPKAVGTHAGMPPIESDRRLLLRLPKGYEKEYVKSYPEDDVQFNAVGTADDAAKAATKDLSEHVDDAVRQENAEYKNRTGHSKINWL